MTTWRKGGGRYQDDTHIKRKAPHPPSFPEPGGVARPACTLQKRGGCLVVCVPPPPNTHPIFDVCSLAFRGPAGPPQTQKTGSLGQFGHGQVSLPPKERAAVDRILWLIGEKKGGKKAI